MDAALATLAFIDGLGTPEMMLIFVLILLLFGGQKLPEFARGIGKSLREFKKAAAGVEDEFKRALDDDERKQNQLKLAENQATASAPATPPDPGAGPNAPSDSHHDPYHYDDYSPDQDYKTAHPDTPVSPAPPETTAPAENKILPPEAPAAPAAADEPPARSAAPANPPSTPPAAGHTPPQP
jgi:sec-independent protein translocase protein TatA